MSKTNQRWQNRIIGYDNVAPDQLLANPANFRVHPKKQQDALTGSLSELGWLQDIVVNRVTGHVLDGHLRVSLALRNGEPTVPVKYVALSESDEKLALAVFDPITYMAETDAAQLDALLQEINTGDAALQALLAELAQKAGLHGVDDPMAEWKGMPEFEHEDLTAFRSIHVHFANQEDVDAFARLVGQKIGEKTRSLWYPEAEKIDMLDIYVNEQS